MSTSDGSLGDGQRQGYVPLARMRYATQRARLLIALWPLWLVLLFWLGLVVAAGLGAVWAAVPSAAALVVMVVAIPSMAGGIVRSRWAIMAWPLDAQAADLGRRAHLPKGDRTLVPLVLGVRCWPAGRIYSLRALPGQSLADFEHAADVLRLRWGARVFAEADGAVVRLTVEYEAPGPVPAWVHRS